MNLSKEIKEAYEYIKSKSKYSPKIGLVLGTGLGDLANEIEEAEYYRYMDIPNFPRQNIIDIWIYLISQYLLLLGMKEL